MKALITATVLALSSFGATAAMDPYVETTLISVCKTGLSNNQVQFTKTMQENRINESRIFPRLVCNGESFHQFAINNGADRTANRIARYLPGKVTIHDLTMIPKDELLYVNF
ncbi:DUF3718 domain-containing protein [Shewanella cyperi]|uniref:DUF3718 domain-containing protein n=1 Tax=Shewanella cyperi TaxID=2814292 RepID=A0A975AM40_9GAMM|nr:DUF3718 domain-containing protein [Shewanella cyperi]QSX31067.1 DUF3718 domain-containing protein [Shewanella cyperi]